MLSEVAQGSLIVLYQETERLNLLRLRKYFLFETFQFFALRM